MLRAVGSQARDTGSMFNQKSKCISKASRHRQGTSDLEWSDQSMEDSQAEGDGEEKEASAGR